MCFVVSKTGKGCVFSVLIGMSITTVYAADYSYLDDSYRSAPPAVSEGGIDLSAQPFPRLMLGDTQSLKGTAQQYSKYNILAEQNGGGGISKIQDIQSIDPDFLYFRQVNPREFLDYLTNRYCTQMWGKPFEATGPASIGCDMFAGHWMYAAGTTLISALSETGQSVSVEDASRFEVGEYAVIYDAPAGSFNNAEHAKISGRNLSTNTLTLSVRGYKSAARSHPAGSIIAQHVLGQGGGNPLNWSYNMSTVCPRDANGKTYGEVEADWLKKNYNNDIHGNPYNVKVSGFLFDSDFYFMLKRKNVDANNDLLVDNGVSNSGRNWWGEGLSQYYAMVRASFPDMFVVSGSGNSRGFQSLNGAQMEGWPVSNGFFSSTPQYDTLDALLARYSYNLHRVGYGSVVTQALSKTPTVQYPNDASPTPTSNRPFRFGFGLTLLDDGYYGQVVTTADPDPWYDEYSVDVTPGSSTYGVAAHTNPNNESEARKHRGWLGMPRGHRVRLYDSTTFAPSQSWISNGDFESDFNGWSGKNVQLNRDTTTAQEGVASLRASKQISYNAGLWSSWIHGPTVSVVEGRQYTLAFSVKASAVREVQVKVGSIGQTFLIGTDWQRYVMTFKAPSSSNSRLSFNIGKENTQVWIDAIYLFEGNADVFRRDFDHGVVVVNATPTTRTVNLNGTFQRIKGFQDSINNGATVSSVTLAAYDAAILVRPDGAIPPSGSKSDSDSGNVACGAPSYEAAQTKAIFLWQNCSTGGWSVRATAGGSSSGATYEGSVSADQSFSDVTPYSLESGDAFDSSDPRQIDFTIKMWASAQDGFDFSSPAGANPCFTLSSLPSGAQVLLGKNKTPVSTPINLATLGSCAASKSAVATERECGAPAYNLNTDTGLYLWKDCSTGAWQLRTTAGGDSKTVSYRGEILSSQPLATIGGVDLERRDRLDTSDPLLTAFRLRTDTGQQDGLAFRPAADTATCLRLKSPAGTMIRLGSEAVEVGSSLDLMTLSACQ